MVDAGQQIQQGDSHENECLTVIKKTLKTELSISLEEQ